MTCYNIAKGVIVCAPDPGNYRKRYLRCPTCECVTEMVALYEFWYGATFCCCRCGDQWGDGERCERPFYRYWRRDAVRRNRRLWDRASHGPPPSFEDEFAELDRPSSRRPVVDVHLPPMPGGVA